MPHFAQHVAAYLLRFSFLVLLMGSACYVGAQGETDTIRFDTTIQEKTKGSIFKGRPGRAILYSLIIPGTGQLYNKSYLRVPFVWGAVGGMGYLLHYNTVQYTCARDAYIAKVDNVPWVPGKNCKDDYKDRLLAANESTLRVIRDNANANRQLAIIGFSLVWLANGIDAFVDAHLKDFTVDDDLSINFSTRLDNDPYAPMRVGMFLTLK